MSSGSESIAATHRVGNGVGRSVDECYNSIMSKKPPLSQTNPFLKDPQDRRFWITTTVTSSASIEGVHFSKVALKPLSKGGSTIKYVFGKSSGSRK